MQELIKAIIKYCDGTTEYSINELSNKGVLIIMGITMNKKNLLPKGFLESIHSVNYSKLYFPQEIMGWVKIK
jgi:hypothetical protein